MTKIANFNHWLFWSNGSNSLPSLAYHFLLVFLSPPDSHASLFSSLLRFHFIFLLFFFLHHSNPQSTNINHHHSHLVYQYFYLTHHHLRPTPPSPPPDATITSAASSSLFPHLRGPQSHPPPPPRYSTTSDHLLHYHRCFCLNQKRFFLYPHYSLLSSNLKEFCFTFFFSDLDSWMEMWDWGWRTEVSNKRKEVFTRLRKDEKTNEGWGRLIRQTKLE